MRILYLSQYFPPEMGAPSARVSELARRWVCSGHEVCVLTAFPHHPTGIVPEKYRGKFLVHEKFHGVEVVRSFVYAAPNRGIIKRAFSYLSFAVSAVLLGAQARQARSCDLVIATSPQFLCAIAGYVISRLKRVPFVLEIRDLWPQSIVEVGALSDKHALIWLLRRIETFLYRSADFLIGVTDAFRETWITQGISPEKIHVIKNGVDIHRFKPAEKENEVRREFGLEGKFVVSYIGTIGMAHGLATLLDAAEILREEKEILFLLVGEGAERSKLAEIAKKRKISNVIFTGEQPREKIPAFLCASDLCAVLLRRTELFKKVIPSKIFEIMGCGRPILLGVSGECERLVTAAGCGYIVPPEDPFALVAEIRRAKEDPDEASCRGEKGRKFVVEHFDRDELARQYVNVLQSLVHSTKQAMVRREV